VHRLLPPFGRLYAFGYKASSTGSSLAFSKGDYFAALAMTALSTFSTGPKVADSKLAWRSYAYEDRD
jgi:hypothetical protein